ncbi:MAG: cytochrome b/b6 domain-containing protein [Hyphomonadaceae bacterium]|nr:cytochrome b/b6 domain-containing protein [Hyphomonadaceae bacterium]
MSETSASRYSAVAIVLHWAIATAIIGNILIGWWMGDALKEPASQAQAIAAFQLHKSIGLSVLLLSLVRLGWRLGHPVPPLPAHMPAWERIAASGVHWIFYGLMIGLPLSGWLYVSTGWSAPTDRPLEVPTLYFGLFQVPHLFGLEHAAEATRRAVSHAALLTHENFARAVIYVLLPLHVLGALKHHFKDRDDVLTRMIPGLKAASGEAGPRDPKRALAIGVGLGAVVVAAIAIVAALVSTPASAPAVAQAPEPPAAAQGAVEEKVAAPVEAEAAAAAPAPSVPAQAGPPAAWAVNSAQSEIAFTGVHAGVNFRGRFARWRADIRFDPDNLAQSSAAVTVETGSAADGVPLHDQSMPTREWFDVANHPTATFRATRFRRGAGGAYTATGTLTLKGKDIPITLPFTLTIAGNTATMSGRASIDRAAADLGMASDPDAEYVSQAIGVEVRVVATRAP